MGCSQSYWRYDPCALLLRQRVFLTLPWRTGGITYCELSSGKSQADAALCLSGTFVLTGPASKAFPSSVRNHGTVEVYSLVGEEVLCPMQDQALPATGMVCLQQT